MLDFLALAARELVMLAGLLAVGSGVACLPSGLSPVVRIALAPALGWALASCALFSAAPFVAQRTAGWFLLLPLAVLSPAFAIWRIRRAAKGRTLDLRDLACLGAVLLLVATTLSLPLALRGSLGPVGYTVSDAVGYVGATDGLESNAFGGDSWGPEWDITARFGWGYAEDYQHIGEMMYPAALNGVLGWNASETHSSMMICLILVAASAAFGVALALTRLRGAALLAGALSAGPLFVTLFLNGSMATLAGQALLLTFGLFSLRVLARPATADVLVLGLLAAALQTLFASVVPAIVLAGAAVLVVVAVRARRAGQLTRPALLRAGRVLGAVLVLAVVLSPASFIRDLELWRSVAAGNDVIPQLPYVLALSDIPGWLLQTQEFFGFQEAFRVLDPGSLRDWLGADVVPILLLPLIVLAIVRDRRLLVFVALFAGGAAAALFADADRDCAYCVERSLAAVAPVVALLLAATVAMLWRLPWRHARTAAVGVSVVLVAAVVHSSVQVGHRAANASMLSEDVRDIADAARDREGAILLEAFDRIEEAPTEMGSTYHLLNSTTSGMLALDAEHNGNAGLVYLPLGVFPPSTFWTPDYRWVVTRAPSIETPREVVKRRGPYALQRRVSPYDAAVVNGIVIDRAKRDPQGIAYVSPQRGPLEFWVAAEQPEPVWLRITLDGPGTNAIPRPKGAIVELREGDRLDLCVRVPGTAPQRRVSLPLEFVAPDPAPSGVEWDRSTTPRPGPRLTRMSATPVRCARPGRTGRSD